MKKTLFALAAIVASACGGKSPSIDRPLDIEVTLVSVPPNAREFDKRLPITFDTGNPYEFVIDLRMRNLDGSTRTKFTGTDAWVRLSFSPAGQIIESIGPKGPDDPDVSGPNIHLTNGEAKGIKVRVVGAFGDTRVVAQDVGFVPAPTTTVATCADGKDNDGNGYADWPNDPNCLFLNDDSEKPFDAGFGTSGPIFFANPTIRDVQLGQASPFLSKQVNIDGPRRVIVSAIVNNGMYVTDIDQPVTSCKNPDCSCTFGTDCGLGDVCAAPKSCTADAECAPAGGTCVGNLCTTRSCVAGSKAIFVFTFSTPFGVKACDRLLRVSGNVADFFGGTQLGTPGWSSLDWINPQTSGTCLIPEFVAVDGTVAGQLDQMESLESSLVVVRNPTIGTHFGKEKVPVEGGNPMPIDGASNCDLNGDGIVGYNPRRGGFSELEKACNDNCTRDPDCTEWNNFVGFNQVKIKIAPADGTLFFSPGAIPGFDTLSYVGPGKLAEIRGVVTHFAGPTPPYSVEPRCADDVIPVGTPPEKIKNAQTACVKSRTGIDEEGQN